MQLVLLDLLLKKSDSFLVELVFVLKCFHDTISYAVYLLEVVNFTVVVTDEASLVFQLPVLVSQLDVGIVHHLHELGDSLLSSFQLEARALELLLSLDRLCLQR